MKSSAVAPSSAPGETEGVSRTLKRWLLASLVAAIDLPFMASATTDAQSDHATTVAIRLWQSIEDPASLAISVRPEGGVWADLGTVPLEVPRRTDSRRYRYGDIALAGIELRVWQGAARAAHFVSARREGGLWADLDTVAIDLRSGNDSRSYRYGDITVALPSPGPDRALLVDAGGEHSCALRASGEVSAGAIAPAARPRSRRASIAR